MIDFAQAIELIKQHNLAFGPNKASNSGSFALATKNPSSEELTPEELDAIVKGAFSCCCFLYLCAWN